MAVGGGVHEVGLREVNQRSRRRIQNDESQKKKEERKADGYAEERKCEKYASGKDEQAPPPDVAQDSDEGFDEGGENARHT